LALLDLDSPEDFFREVLQSGVLSEHPDMRRYMGPKGMLQDQAQVQDVLETSVSGLESRRRSVAAQMKWEDNIRFMGWYGWNATEWKNRPGGTPWGNNEDGVVWDTLQLPQELDGESVRPLSFTKRA
jgi:hypothetical protein